MKKLTKIISIYHKLEFGKYNGKTIKEIIEIEPEYIIWVHDNVINGIRFSPEIMTKVIQTINKNNDMEDDKYLD